MVLDWEDKYDRPNSFLRRFPDDFVRAETIGWQGRMRTVTVSILRMRLPINLQKHNWREATGHEFSAWNE